MSTISPHLQARWEIEIGKVNSLLWGNRKSHVGFAEWPRYMRVISNNVYRDGMDDAIRRGPRTVLPALPGSTELGMKAVEISRKTKRCHVLKL